MRLVRVILREKESVFLIERAHLECMLDEAQDVALKVVNFGKTLYLR